MAAMFKVVPKVGPLARYRFQGADRRRPRICISRASIRRSLSMAKLCTRSRAEICKLRRSTWTPANRRSAASIPWPTRPIVNCWINSPTSSSHTSTNRSARDILRFYEGFGFPPAGTRIDKCVVQRWTKTWVELTQLRSFEILDQFDQPGNPIPPAMPTTTAAASLSCGQ